MAAIMMSTQGWARSHASLRPIGLTSSVETERSMVNGSGRSQEVGTLDSRLREERPGVVHLVFSRTRSQFIVSSCRGKGGHSDYRQMSQEYDHRRTVVDIRDVALFVTQGHGTRGGIYRSKDQARRAMARIRTA
jgi:hypothetical protein